MSENRTYKIVVNGREREVHGPTISYAQLIAIAFPEDQNSLYSVNYVCPHVPDGSLAEGKDVELHEEMKFDATKTHRS